MRSLVNPFRHRKNIRQGRLELNRKQADDDQNRIAAFARRPSDADYLEEGSGSSEDVRRLRPLTVLEHLIGASHPLTLGQLAGLMCVPRSTLMRLLRSMEMKGYVLHLPAERGFVAGKQSVALAHGILRGSNMRRECRAVLRNLVERVGETCNLTVPDAGRVLYVERVECTHPLRMHLKAGGWVPMHCTASGKLFMASMSVLERQNILENMVLKTYSPRTIVDRKELDAELNRIAKRGFGIDNEEFVRGMVAVSVPVFGTEGKPVAAIACHAPTARLSLDELVANVPHLRLACEQMQLVLFRRE